MRLGHPPSLALARNAFIPRAATSSDKVRGQEEASNSGEEHWAAKGVKQALRVALTGVLCCGIAAVIPTSENYASVLNHMVGAPSPANASGLLLMPPVRLVNRYYLVRSGESTFETRGLINTNPVAKTSMDSGLSEAGKRQTIKAAKELRDLGACDDSCWIWPSINQRAYQTAEIIAYVNNVNRSRIVPEYSFLDARGLGAYEGRGLASVNEVYDIDALSSNLRPPPYSDGTPNESVADVLVRVTQLMSILETQYFNETIVIVAPDSDNLSVLEAGLTGLDLRRHRQLAYGPGEVRFVDATKLPPPRKAASGLIKINQ